MSIKHHPDKNRDDPHAEERFKEIAVAYQTLSDPALRKKYNEFGPKESAPEGGFVDPEEVFSAIFGGERFVPIIGEISLGREMKAALQEADEAEAENEPKARDSKGREIISPEEKAKMLKRGLQPIHPNHNSKMPYMVSDRFIPNLRSTDLNCNPSSK